MNQQQNNKIAEVACRQMGMYGGEILEEMECSEAKSLCVTLNRPLKRCGKPKFYDLIKEDVICQSDIYYLGD